MEWENALHDLAEGIEHSDASGKLLSRHEAVPSNDAGARLSRYGMAERERKPNRSRPWLARWRGGPRKIFTFARH